MSTHNISSDFISIEEEAAGSIFEKITTLPDKGGTADAYIARRHGKDYFMKKLKPEFAGDLRYRNLLRKEYDLGRSVNSPHIVAYESIACNDVDAYLLMEYVQGATLDQKLAAAPEWFSSRANLDHLFCQLLSGLKQLHGQGIVHADLRPENIMLTRVNNDVKIIDLGFAFTAGYAHSAGYTPQFAAPEQLGGNSEEIDTRTDIYAVGKLMEYIRTESDIPLPGVYRKVMARCLQADKNKRFSSVDEILQRLTKRRRTIRKVMITLCISFVLGFSGYIYFNTAGGQETLTNIKLTLSIPDYDFSNDHVLYRYQSDEHSALEVVGARIFIENFTTHDMNNIKIQSHITTAEGQRIPVTSIADAAFRGGKTYSSAFIPEGIRHIGAEAFFYCSGISAIHLPSTVDSIGEQAFGEMNSLKVLTLPDSITHLPYRMAHHCRSLRHIRLPKRVRTLPMDLLACNINLREVVLPDSLKRIERGVFWKCSRLPQITLPATVKYIGEYVFYHCDSLKHIYLHAPEPPEMYNAFNNKKQSITIHVPKNSETRYKQHFYWKQMNIVGDL